MDTASKQGGTNYRVSGVAGDGIARRLGAHSDHDQLAAAEGASTIGLAPYTEMVAITKKVAGAGLDGFCIAASRTVVDDDAGQLHSNASTPSHPLALLDSVKLPEGSFE